ncbi:Oidioi.mRNA.OKI2018_I69.PAR.g8723.t1.cds [Oikopleura dioica]|uniref:Carbohydrate sulfotransferase n=1 Tax=Oikopleura dioica TaxID=34765 RepID=A0ABN7RLB9_OIKDI|nr:Oidioi.mRNA.OKI2018_I69.PAR.g8723.t1.cds [Oikopleura dioica]
MRLLVFLPFAKGKTGLEVLEKRADILRETCTRDFHRTPRPRSFTGNHNAIVRFEESGLRICVPWKCASQYVKHIHDVVISDSEDNRRFVGDTQEKKNSTVLIARHPFVRLISSWNDKLLRENVLQSGPMMRHFNIDRFVTSDHETHLISFEDFLNYMVYAIEHDEPINRHFQPQHNMCDPCSSDFNTVLKVEHLKDEMVVLFRSHDLHVKELEETFHEQTGGFGAAEKDKLIEKVRSTLRPIPKETLWKIYDYYKNDFDILNYSFDMDMLTIGGF